MINKLDLRPVINTEEFDESTEEEKFQSLTLRPILKLQNELILGIFKNCILESKSSFYTLSAEQKANFVLTTLQKNNVLKNKLIGMVIGMFSLEELVIYSAKSSLYNKRITSLLIERIRSQIKEL